MATVTDFCKNGHNLGLPGAFRLRRYWCKKYKKFKYTRLCNKCLKAHWKRRNKHKEYQKQKKIRVKRKAAGLCPNCGQRKPQANKTMCFKCLLYDAKRQDAKRQKLRGTNEV